MYIHLGALNFCVTTRCNSCFFAQDAKNMALFALAFPFPHLFPHGGNGGAHYFIYLFSHGGNGCAHYFISVGRFLESLLLCRRRASRFSAFVLKVFLVSHKMLLSRAGKSRKTFHKCVSLFGLYSFSRKLIRETFCWEETGASGRRGVENVSKKTLTTAKRRDVS